MTLEGRRVLFISYNGMLDPLGQSQVIPYLRELASQGVSFTLLSFERACAFTGNGPLKCEELRRELATHNIEWHWLRYHKKPSVPATAYDVVAGIRYASQLVKRNKIEMVHARNHIPAAIALQLKKKFGIKMIFDLRGLMAEEYVDAKHWQHGSIPYRITKATERRAFAAADGIVTLTERIWPVLKEWQGLAGRDVHHTVVPCCADLNLFRFSAADRVRRRKELGFSSDHLVVVYSGSIDGWYLTEEMADFIAALMRNKPNFRALWLTTNGHDRIGALMSRRAIKRSTFKIVAAAPRDVPSYLSASDVGLAFIKPCFSKLASSPTKNAEYLACGLPLIINAGIGDSDELVTRERAGTLVNKMSQNDFANAVTELESWFNNPDETRRRTREVAKRLFDLKKVGAQRYAEFYLSVLG